MSALREEENGGLQGAAIQKPERSSNMFEGKIVSLANGKLVMTNKQGKEYSHTLAKDAKLTCDGATCKADDRKTGSRIRVTTPKDDRNVATGVESLDKNAEFEECCS